MIEHEIAAMKFHLDAQDQVLLAIAEKAGVSNEVIKEFYEATRAAIKMSYGVIDE